MITEEAVLNFLQVRVQDKVTLAWTDIASEAVEVRSNRGGKRNYGGIVTIDAGTLDVRLKNVYDPAFVQFLSPQMIIQVYNTTFATPDEGSLFLGTIDDIETNYVLKTDGDLDTYVTIFASDAVASHNNISINGVHTEAGYQRWEERVATLEPKAVTEVVVPSVNADILIYSI